ncbi:hypothetical protein F4778DRAFT_4206 [Xylariomycetidae sp. FL2044]|nr:hypothetical protein F4778DRAFT_4206 [Xylariomycetidae sp. FL2044]
MKMSCIRTFLAALSIGQATAALSAYTCVLSPSQTAMTSVSSALRILTNHHADPISSTLDTNVHNTDDYIVFLPRSDEYMDFARKYPEARFILAILDESEDYIESIRDYFNASKKSEQLLELPLHPSDSGLQSQSWVRLCEFLGLGYSVVERFNLWRFP